MDTVRTTILKAIKQRFEAIEPPSNIKDPGYVFDLADWPLKFSVVALGPLGQPDHSKAYVAGIVPISDKETAKFPFVYVDTRIGIEFRATRNKGDDAPVIVGERLLGVVKRAIMMDPTWGGLAIDTNLDGNEIDLISYEDKTIAGVQFLEVKYRHDHRDPRTADGNV